MRDPSMPLADIATLIAQASTPQRCRGSGYLRGRCETMVDGPYLCDHCATMSSVNRHDKNYEAASMSVPPRYRWARRKSEELVKRVSHGGAAIRDVFEGVVEQGKNGYIHGPTGTGKTSVSVAALHEVIDLGRIEGAPLEVRTRSALARFAAAMDLTLAAQQTRFGTGAVPEITAAKRATILVLDDIGKEADTRTVFEVIDERYRNGLQTVITTNLEIQECDRRYGQGLVRRVIEGGLYLHLK